MPSGPVWDCDWFDLILACPTRRKSAVVVGQFQLSLAVAAKDADAALVSMPVLAVVLQPSCTPCLQGEMAYAPQ
eukprot:4002560-Amphidinium_carterae.1